MVRRDDERGSWFFVVDVDSVDGRRRQLRRRGFPTKRAAHEAMRALVAAGPSAYASGTVAEFLDRWINARAGALKPSTLDSYRRQIDAYVRPRIGALPLRNLDGARLTALYSDLVTGGGTGARAGPGRAGRPLAPKTVVNVAGMLHKACKDAVRWGVLTSNPADAAELPRRSQPEMRAWEVSDVRRFLAAAGDDPHLVAWWLMLHTGARRGEVLGLDWGAIDLDGRALTVKQTWSMVGTEPSMGTPKTAAGLRTIALDAGTVAVLRRWRRSQAEQRLVMGGGWPDHTAVVTEPDGRRVHPQVLTRRFKALCRVAGVPTIRLHDLRHTVASVALANGEDVAVLSRRLGHADVAVTLRLYRHVMPGEDQAAADRLASLWANP
jgi:integrase